MSDGMIWAAGTWERASGLDSFTIMEDGTLNYKAAHLKDVNPQSKSDNEIEWSSQSILGMAKIKLIKISDSEAKLVTQIGEMKEEKAYTKK